MNTKKYYKLVRVDYRDTDTFKVTNISDSVGMFSYVKNGNPANETFEYNTNGVDWTQITVSDTFSVQIQPGGSIYMRNNQMSRASYDSFYSISMDVPHEVSGDITKFSIWTNAGVISNLQNMFNGDSELVSVSKMTFGGRTTVNGRDRGSQEGAMYCMFKNCTSLIDVPDMSGFTALNAYSFSYMFMGCTSLNTVPVLTNLQTVNYGSFDSMFYNCTSLVNGMDISNLSNRGSRCFQYMYSGCSSLTTAYAANFVYGDNGAYTYANWLNNVSASGTVYFKTQEIADSMPGDSISGVPTGWTKSLIQ